MRLHVATKKVTRVVAEIAGRMEQTFRHGTVEVISMLCNDCGRWVKPDDWNPEYAYCEVCSGHARLEGRRAKAAACSWRPEHFDPMWMERGELSCLG